MKRLDILDFFRGWASILVVISHLMGVFWVGQSGLESLMGYQSIGELNLPYAKWIIENKLFFGQFGVAIFFLISGYVITLSLEKYHGFGFLINRIIRIYPVYIIGFLFLILGLYIVDFDHNGIPYTRDHLLIHMLIVVRQWLDYKRIDGISWTLEIELYFYITMFMLFQFKNDIRHTIISIFFITLLLGVIFIPLDWYQKRQLLMIAYMLLGYMVYKVKNNTNSITQLIFFYLITLAVMYNFYSNTKPFSNHLLSWYVPYMIAPLLFFWAIFYLDNYKIDIISKFFANISYPLYVVHQIFGYALLVYLLKAGYSSWSALIIVISGVIFLAYLIHLFIEKPAFKFAKKFNQKKV